MKILIVGSKGFIGSHCVDYFSRDNDVWECDVVLEYGNDHYLSIDAVDSDFLELFRKHQFDVCINCSGAANVPFSMEKPFNDFRLNTYNVLKLLEAIRLFSPECKFINMSSAAVYGNPISLPVSENSKTQPVSPYGCHKIMTEMICREYSSFWNVQTCCLRIFSAFGPRLKKQIFWDMYKKFKEQDTIELWGTGSESRDFIYISDIIDVIDLAIKNSTFKSEIVNVANGCQITISDLAYIFVKLLGTEKKVVFNNVVRVGDPINWEADISIIKSWGYKQKVNIEEGVEKYIIWLKNNK
ncbi:NAD-dependent epimerase/dehydratase family protein [Xylanibacter oryzae]|uniref:NAD-dependent epimerase/dehydratase family protein n=1 Tax=Xylanibacter oryzae TaxID=185293 RepID=UPI0004BA1857|nr:SDR family oxidoreductase [Xylanibacter oryzae]